MKKLLALMLSASFMVSLAACGGNTTSDVSGTSGANVSGSSETNTPSGSAAPSDDASNSQEVTVPNNGEWDEILCSGDGYHLVIKEVDAYDGYKVQVGVVDDTGEWVHELTDTGAFAEGIQLRVDLESDVLLDSGSYAYLGEGVFIGSPGLTIYSADGESKIGPWQSGWATNAHEETNDYYVIVQGWECLFWNVVDNIQMQFYATKISEFQDGYSLFTETEKKYKGIGTLKTLNPQGEITELPCEFDPTSFDYKFPVYSEGLFFTTGPDVGFYDIEGNQIIDLPLDTWEMPYSEELGINAPYFENGEATILFKNNGGSVFKGIIDKSGNFVGEPEKVELTATFN